MSSSEDTKSFLKDFVKEEHSENADDGVFYFETDFLALKNNRDYLKLMKSLAILESQRIKVSQDIEKLEELKLKVEYDPEGVRDKILEGKSDFIHRLKIANVPEIDWSKYSSSDLQKKAALKTRRMTKQPSGSAEEPKSNTNDVAQESQEGDRPIKIRGRVYNDKKPETFNQLWTVEEQLRLEQLLIEYPPEPIENRRWKKIADALGNRTTKQVCSRVQKYFRKLHKLGLGPARTAPKTIRPAHVYKKNKHLLYKPTTFFPGVAMGELESESEEDSCTKEELDLSHWESITEKIEEEKSANLESEDMVQHFGYKCDFCEETPILGTRWTCSDCPEFQSCSNCLLEVRKKKPPPHPLIHKFNPVTEFINPYYSSQALGSDNYLDPNYASNGLR